MYLYPLPDTLLVFILQSIKGYYCRIFIGFSSDGFQTYSCVAIGPANLIILSWTQKMGILTRGLNFFWLLIILTMNHLYYEQTNGNRLLLWGMIINVNLKNDNKRGKIKEIWNWGTVIYPKCKCSVYPAFNSMNLPGAVVPKV